MPADGLSGETANHCGSKGGVRTFSWHAMPWRALPDISCRSCTTTRPHELPSQHLMRYILFDIDGTLTAGGEGGGAGSTALNLAFQDLFGVANAFDRIQKAGKTDPIITREGFALNRVEFSEGRAEEFKERYLHHLSVQVNLPKKRYQVLPGVINLLDALRREDVDVVLGLLTGNWMSGARIKLASVTLDWYFENGDGGPSGEFRLGAFGEDAPTRPELVPVAWRRFHERTGQAAGPERTYIIGDTPRDVECAHANGARAVAVGTGPFGVEELRAAGPDLLVRDLSRTSDLVKYLVG